ncbi:hypothetical protein LGM90_26545 [Burkholderia sp. AU28942]|uniref:hypothetical protein n=1 Tax=Burkholderia TaxID=32008 RepID=UPI0009F3C9D9|nr:MULTISPECIES: hypothetical protein [Burkholderia]MCA8312075.1 hypothetical protein [Burkholderia sp. AU28942]
MSDIQPVAIPVLTDKPRHPQQEIIDLLAVALLRLRAHLAGSAYDRSEPVGLGFFGHERVNTNPSQPTGVRS